MRDFPNVFIHIAEPLSSGPALEGYEISINSGCGFKPPSSMTKRLLRSSILDQEI
jgi:hypothetical protein